LIKGRSSLGEPKIAGNGKSPSVKRGRIKGNTLEAVRRSGYIVTGEENVRPPKIDFGFKAAEKIFVGRLWVLRSRKLK